MKKFAVCLISTVLLFILCACSGEKIQQTTDPIETTEETTTAIPTVQVTFPEGFTVVQIAKRLEENGVCPAADFIALTQGDYYKTLEYRFIRHIDEEKASLRAFALEGYIFPDTYEFYKGESAEKALSRFLQNTENKLNDEYYIRAEYMGYSMDDIITMASIILKEVGNASDMKKVSSVLYNRINSPDYGKLQCDCGKGYIRNYLTDSPYLTENADHYTPLYDTYECKGLSVGAICNPGITAIEAALYPDDTNYFFFVTDSEWNCYFSETYARHKEYCEQIGLEG